MSALRFFERSPVVESAPGRVDVACFVGFVARRGSFVPPEITGWLQVRNYPAPDDLHDVPVPIDTWDVFDRLFAWERRPLGVRDETLTSYMGAAVRSFFAQGGRKCYVVRVGDPWALNDVAEQTADRADQMAIRVSALVPGYPGVMSVDILDQSTWKGVGHLAALNDVSFVCLPDLPDLVRVPDNRIEPPEELPRAPEVFVECSDDESPDEYSVRGFTVPRCDDAGYQVWAQILRAVSQWLLTRMRITQVIAAVPIPARHTLGEGSLLRYLRSGFLDLHPNSSHRGVATSFVQLAYPWIRTNGSARLPDRLEPPDAALAGILARNALSNGTFRSAAGQRAGDVYDTFPLLSSADLNLFDPEETLIDRVSLIGRTPAGWALLSDITASAEQPHRQGSIHRLISVIIRSAQRLGETLVFEPSGETLWARVRQELDDVLHMLYQLGGLRGRTADDAYSIRCDRSTMTQADIDAGRLIVEVRLQPATPIRMITVILAMAEGHPVSLVGMQ